MIGKNPGLAVRKSGFNIHFFLVASCVILGKAHNNSEFPVAYLSNKMKTNLCLSHAQRWEEEDRGTLPRTLPSLKAPQSTMEPLSRISSQKREVYAVGLVLPREGSVQRHWRWRIAFAVFLLLSAAIPLFLPSMSSPSPVMVPPQRQSHWARVNY